MRNKNEIEQSFDNSRIERAVLLVATSIFTMREFRPTTKISASKTTSIRNQKQGTNDKIQYFVPKIRYFSTYNIIFITFDSLQRQK